MWWTSPALGSPSAGTRAAGTGRACTWGAAARADAANSPPTPSSPPRPSPHPRRRPNRRHPVAALLPPVPLLCLYPRIPFIQCLTVFITRTSLRLAARAYSAMGLLTRGSPSFLLLLLLLFSAGVYIQADPIGWVVFLRLLKSTDTPNGSSLGCA